jgi:uncharacterized protein YgiM (DUF1202 family)
LGKVVRALIGLVVVCAIGYTVYAWYGDYKTASVAARASQTTSTAPATATVVPVQGQRAVILVEGVEMNPAPAAGTKAVRKLKKGEELVLVGITANSWLQVRDDKGRQGYVANKSGTVRLQK